MPNAYVPRPPVYFVVFQVRLGQGSPLTRLGVLVEASNEWHAQRKARYRLEADPRVTAIGRHVDTNRIRGKRKTSRFAGMEVAS